jgi:ABC-type bacteriocin/lantibiotic exporter with double-glycine peptidase domain
VHQATQQQPRPEESKGPKRPSPADCLQERLLSRVVRLPMSFFDSQPTGRLLNRFTKDTEAVDVALQSSVSSFLNCAIRWA